MEELAYVAAKIVKGMAGLAYLIGDGLSAMTGSESQVGRRSSKKDDKKDEER
ncbi:MULTISPECIES: hypothetical protein [Streptomyces]|uniref:Uncharacterized protein n=1 Tax=Streptomyces katrae TaxID=68223 RepID=A0ABT7GLN9_9ACTN|nr:MULTISPECIES: hypothetical protein [Streptomyces]MDK9494497.1 hypothetical protein [Streptomyces katrae]GLX22236.1 hypothetical protein Slala01_58800 [Streptomyces lavendulae subsp. lavendulae]GLX26719.1 hypothetical protein Slala02_25390 [Streptomyces lavendulae subsp. lavendulae]